jgi:SAM-dependent methyltransferase
LNKQYYTEYYTLEREHWWFTCRLIILKSMLVKKIRPNKPLKILNVGAATGATTTMLEDFGDVTTLEYDKECCEFLFEKLGIEAVNASLTDLPFDSNSFDLVCAFDVIEHIDDDLTATSEIKRVLQPDGHFFLTVPAFNFLWSHHDVVNHHFRRYSFPDLNQVLTKAGLDTEFNTYFNFFMFMPVFVIRFLQKLVPRKSDTDSTGSDFEVMSSSSVFNSVLYSIFYLENILLKLGIKFPWGVSIAVIGKKRK